MTFAKLSLHLITYIFGRKCTIVSLETKAFKVDGVRWFLGMQWLNLPEVWVFRMPMQRGRAPMPSLLHGNGWYLPANRKNNSWNERKEHRTISGRTMQRLQWLLWCFPQVPCCGCRRAVISLEEQVFQQRGHFGLPGMDQTLLVGSCAHGSRPYYTYGR